MVTSYIYWQFFQTSIKELMCVRKNSACFKTQASLQTLIIFFIVCSLSDQWNISTVLHL